MSNEPLTEPTDAKIFLELSTSELKFVEGTKKLTFDISDITTETERTCVAPNADALLPAKNSTSIATLTTLPVGANNTFYGISAGSDVTSGTNNLIAGFEAKAGSATATGRIVLNTEGKYNNTFHLPSTTMHLPNLQNNTFSKVIYFDPTTSTIAYGDPGVGGGGASTMADGSEVTPGLKFENETTTGFYRTTAGKFSIGIQSAERVRFDGNQILSVAGATPSFSFISAATSGIGYSSSALRFYNTDEKLSLGSTINSFSKGLLIAHSATDNRETYDGATFSQVVSVGQDASNGAGNFRFGVSLDVSGVNLNTNYLQTAQNVRLAYLRTSATATTQGAEVGRLSFFVKPAGGAASEILRLTSSELAGLGTANFTGDVTLQSRLLVPYGLVGTPSIAFSSDATTGIFGASGTINLVTAGTSRLSTSATAMVGTVPIRLGDGLVGTPSYAFSGNTNTGFYQTAANSIGVAANGVNQMTINATALSVVPQILKTSTGSAATPDYSFLGDTDSGLYRIGADSVGISAGASLRFTFGTSTNVSAGPLLTSAGSATNPSFSFSGDSNTGMYSDGSDNILWSTGGTLRMTLASGSLTSTVPFIGPIGSAGGVTYGFAGDLDTGMFSSVADTINWATAGTSRLVLSNSSLTVSHQYLAPTGSTPSYSFTGATTTGLYTTSLGGTVGIVQNGANMIECASSNINVYSPFRLVAGSASIPSVSFGASNTSGFYLAGSSIVGLTISSTQRMTFGASEVTSTIPFRGPLGDFTTPTYSFTADNNTGMYGYNVTGAEHAVGISADGTPIMTLTKKTVSISTSTVLSSSTDSLIAADIKSSSDANAAIFRYSNEGKEAGGIYKNGRVAFSNGSYRTSLTQSNGIHNYSAGSEGLEIKGQSDIVMLRIITDGKTSSMFGSDISTVLNYSDASLTNLSLGLTNNSFTGIGQEIIMTRAQNSAFVFFECKASGGTQPVFRVRGDGATMADGAYSTPASDYAEYFESADGKEIPVGTVVELLPDGKIRPATEISDNIIGVARSKKPSSGSSVIGNSRFGSWPKKYLMNEYDEYILEYHTIWEWEDEKVTDNGKPKKHSYRSDQIPHNVVVPENKRVLSGPDFYHYKLNPDYDPNMTYRSREDRPEWIIVGLLGQVPVKKNQPIPADWIRIGEGQETYKYYIR